MNFIFLTYINRSGSTYLANLLDSSPKILACPEGDFLVTFFLENPGGKFRFDDKTRSRLNNIFSTDPKLQYWGDGKSFFPALEKAENNLEAFFNILINYKNQVKPDAEFILFKAERIVYLVKKIQKVDIEHSIRFISIIRDPRAVFASQKRTCFPETLKIMSNNPVKTTFINKSHLKIILSLQSEINLLIKYENLITDYYSTIQYLGSFLEIDLSEIKPECGTLYYRLPKSHIQIHSNLLEKPNEKNINKWQSELTSDEISIIEKMTGKYLHYFDYMIFSRNYFRIDIYLIIFYHLICIHISKIFKKIKFHIIRFLSCVYKL